MEKELSNFIKVWSIAIASSCYSYSLSKIFHIQKGILRLLFILPVIYLFIILPSSLTTFHLGGLTFFYLVWLGNFKLLLYSFDLGPLSVQPNDSFVHFIAIALLPIKVKDDSRKKEDQVTLTHFPSNDGNEDQVTLTHFPSNDGKEDPVTLTHENKKVNARVLVGRSILFAVKLLAFAVVVKVYDYRQELPQYLLLVNICCHLYLGTELSLAMSVTLVRTTLGFDLDPQFNEPYLATSLQDFWGRRWNLMVSNILRLSTYDPIRRAATPLVGRKMSLVAAMLASFTVSGLMHEVIYYHFTRVKPTWEVTWFFVLQGLCTVGEVMVKQVVGQRFKLHRLISCPITIGFLAVTGWWWFLPQLMRNGVDIKVLSEYALIVRFVKENGLRISS